MGGRRWGLGRGFDRAGRGFFSAWFLELLLNVLAVLNRRQKNYCCLLRLGFPGYGIDDCVFGRFACVGRWWVVVYGGHRQECLCYWAALTKFCGRTTLQRHTLIEFLWIILR
jgi:hypothetical protein